VGEGGVDAKYIFSSSKNEENGSHTIHSAKMLILLSYLSLQK
jgi:hypothetical protein